ncbi:uncharacterized protein LOC116204099 [Punica granatum]|uniref:Uncharacterized protein LOC116204099 n=2 Tax=Punica granatum TaxID=22663 RepID=A0A6P8DBY1_PUNGR|nr:uncharacterized protein LOC116204099 [Punica granatum]PKI64483.1 hypothetical protein CRG98_015119 [Punica granatum]
MSKKKAGGSTMTLKDFHGGSIPSDLPLPSAPGSPVRPSDRPGYDRPASWGNPAGRSDLRSRLNTGTRNFDDKTPFLTPIGRNFDEDERKPLDGVSAPRRMISDDSFRASAGRLELKPQQFSPGRPLGQQGPAQVSPLPSQISYSGRVSGGQPGSVGSQNVYANSGPGVTGSVTNPWATRKEPTGVAESVQPAWSASSATSKLIHASALEKVSSGRWQSKQSIPHEADVEVIKHAEEPGLTSKGYDDAKYSSRVDAVGVREYVDGALPRQMERSLTIGEGVRGARREMSDGEMREEPFYSDEKERNAVIYGEAYQLGHAEGRIVRPEFQRPMSAEAVERPRLRLLPRTKPVENPEQPFAELKQRPESAHSENISAPGVESGSQTVERPKLNLKPRSQPVEHSEGIADRDRSSVFGGARPRELVLKARGVDDVNIDNYDLGQSSERAKQVGTKTERAPGNVTPTHYGEKSERLSVDQRNGRKFERKDQQAEDRSDAQRRNWRNENRRNTRDNTDRQQQQQHHHNQQERRPSPEIWRKPIMDEPNSQSPEPGVRFGKAASAAELAQAFSRPYSAPKAPDQLRTFQGQSQGQIPFSRLTGQAPRTQINGY